MNPLQTIQDRLNIPILINTQDILTLCGISANVQETNLIPSILIATDTYIKPTLGKTLYDSLMVEWIAALKNPNNLPDGTLAPFIDYKTLYIDYVRPSLAWWAYTDFIPVNGLKVEEKGVMLNDSDYGTNAGVEGINKIETRARKNAENYTERLHCYLKETFKDNVDFNKQTEPEGKFFSGIFFPQSKSCSTCR